MQLNVESLFNKLTVGSNNKIYTFSTYKTAGKQEPAVIALKASLDCKKRTQIGKIRHIKEAAFFSELRPITIHSPFTDTPDRCPGGPELTQGPGSIAIPEPTPKAITWAFSPKRPSLLAPVS